MKHKKPALVKGPKVIGNDRGRLLSDKEMENMHKFKKDRVPEKESLAPARKSTMMFAERD